MAAHRDTAIKHGMNLVRDLPDIMPQQADDRLKGLYEDIQQVLRVPVVNQIFRTLANYPDYLEQAWTNSRPVLCSDSFEQAADEIRTRALLDDAPVSAVLGLPDADNAQQLQGFNDTIHYVLPKLLLVCSLFYEASFGDQARGSTAYVEALGTTPKGVAEGATKVEMVNPAEADEEVRQLFEDIKARHGHSVVSSYYRGLAQWPDFLQRAWELTAPYVGSPNYNARRLELIETARVTVRKWPVVPIEPPKAHIDDIRDILTTFQHKFVPEMLLDTALIKAILGGRDAGIKSPLGG